ncbi:MAG: hypothetical protein CG439_2226 [Methylococcaceae bacterium NSP1-2]|nr:MAG: hypothetical protein CG439_2226 [Methylococcaceae bacterium NSP1-2]
MGQKQFEEWIKQNHPQITDTLRYPRTIKTISNHLHKNEVKNSDLYLVNSTNTAKKLRNIYFDIEKYSAQNNRGNNRRDLRTSSRCKIHHRATKTTCYRHST